VSLPPGAMPAPGASPASAAEEAELRVGPLHPSGDPGGSPEERSVLASFCDLHDVPREKVRSAALLDAHGEVQGFVLVAPIDVLRQLARATGKLDRIDPPVFERDAEGLPAAATVRVYRTDLPRGLSRTAFWHERIPHNVDEPGAHRWMTEPDSVLAEVAEALALRGAFPQALEGIYTEADLSEAAREHALARVRARSQLRHTLEALDGTRH
jgi:hypothetical protein